MFFGLPFSYLYIKSSVLAVSDDWADFAPFKAQHLCFAALRVAFRGGRTDFVPFKIQHLSFAALRVAFRSGRTDFVLFKIQHFRLPWSSH